MDTMEIHSESRRFHKNCPKSVPMSLLNEEWAQKNHGQTLKRLNERGGMGVMEILDNIHKRRSSFGTRETEAHLDELLKILNEHVEK